MKLIKKLASAFAVGGLFFAVSCNSGDEKKGDETKTDSSTVKETKAPVKPSNLMIVKHKVADFTKWLPLFEGHDSVRVRYGLHNFIVARGVKDSNMVMIVCRMDDFEKAKAFGALPDLKEVMKKGGVIGAPEITYLDVQMQDTSSVAGTTRVLVSHKVKDWDAWKKSFDDHKANRVAAGLTDRAVGYAMGDNKMVTLAMVVSDMKKAEDFFASKDLKDRMTAAGVDGPPTIFYYNVVKKY